MDLTTIKPNTNKNQLFSWAILEHQDMVPKFLRKLHDQYPDQTIVQALQCELHNESPKIPLSLHGYTVQIYKKNGSWRIDGNQLNHTTTKFLVNNLNDLIFRISGV